MASSKALPKRFALNSDSAPVGRFTVSFQSAKPRWGRPWVPRSFQLKARLRLMCSSTVPFSRSAMSLVLL